MAVRSPSVRRREVIGNEEFSNRREVFGKHDTVFMPASPTSLTPPTYKEVDPIITSNHGKTTSNFKRNTSSTSSMRESRNEERETIRPRKYSDNFTSELNQSDDFSYRGSMTERMRRLSKMRKDFLTSNLNDSTDSPFARNTTRASLPARSSSMRYKIDGPIIYKFPFAEPFATPPPIRKVLVDLGPVEGVEKREKENEDPELEQQRHQSLPPLSPYEAATTKIDRQKLFEELVKKYSPNRTKGEWKLPPTRPRVVGAVTKRHTAPTENTNNDKQTESSDDKTKGKNPENSNNNNVTVENKNETTTPIDPAVVVNNEQNHTDKAEITETNDRVAELKTLPRQNTKELPKKRVMTQKSELTIPGLIDKMTAEGKNLESHKSDKKVKRKRSFIDKLLGRKKGSTAQ